MTHLTIRRRKFTNNDAYATPFLNLLSEHPEVAATVRYHLDEFRSASSQEQDAFCAHLSSLSQPTFDDIRNIARLVCLAGRPLDRIENGEDLNVMVYKYRHADEHKASAIGDERQLLGVFDKFVTSGHFQACVAILIST